MIYSEILNEQSVLKTIKRKILNKLKRLLNESNAISNDATLGDGVIVTGSYVGGRVVVEDHAKVLNSTLKMDVRIGKGSKLEMADLKGTVTCGEGCKFYSARVDGNVSMGNYSSLWGPNLDIITGNGKVTIGNFCSIARNVYMQTFNHNTEKLTSYFIGKNIFKEKWENEQVSKGDISIGHDVWIGTNVTILGGISIGNGAVIAAGTVVTKNVAPFTIIGGVPGKIIGERFDENTIAKIEQLGWWDWPVEKIKEHKHLFEEYLNPENLPQT